jgi:LPXTG-motif cell wall-anchored protein
MTGKDAANYAVLAGLAVLFLGGGYYAWKKHQANTATAATIANPLASASLDVPLQFSATGNATLPASLSFLQTAGGQNGSTIPAYNAAENFGVSPDLGGQQYDTMITGSGSLTG